MYERDNERFQSIENETPFLSGGLFVDREAEEGATFAFSKGLDSPFLEKFNKTILGGEEFDIYADAEMFDADDAENSGEAEADEANTEAFFPSFPLRLSRDRVLAVPSFVSPTPSSCDEMLTVEKARKAVEWNTANHPKLSGIDPSDILDALGSYVNIGQIRRTLQSCKVLLSNVPQTKATNPLIDDVFVEAIHQFQKNCYCDTREHDGIAGPSVLDSLGFWPRMGLRSKAITNQWAKDWIGSANIKRNIRLALTKTPPELAAGLTPENWWLAFVNPVFLGQKFNRPIHVYFARKLRQAERWLLSQTRFAGKTPVHMARLLDINEIHKGGRNDLTNARGQRRITRSIHTLGLALDINGSGNPWTAFGSGASKLFEVICTATEKFGNFKITEETFASYLQSLVNDSRNDTAWIYDTIFDRHRNLQTYLKQSTQSAKDDLRELRGDDLGSVFGDRDPLNGFLNLDKDLVIALRNQACLSWGAVDLGGGDNGNGDMMHFDCRLDQLGQAVYCGDLGNGKSPTHNKNHPCWKGGDLPCSEVGPKSTRGKPTAYVEASHDTEEGESEQTDSEQESPSLLTLPRWLFDQIKSGALTSQAATAMLSGERDVNKLTNMMFYARNPDLPANYKIKEIDTQLLRQWKDIRDKSIVPALNRLNGNKDKFNVPKGFELKERQRKVRGLYRYGGGRLDQRLSSMSLAISSDDIDTFQRIANVETSGCIQGINTWDSAVVSLGFMQWTLQHGKLQEWIKRSEPAFGRFSIELDLTREYEWLYKNGKRVTQTAIKGAPTKNELRWGDWAKRFFEAGLDDEIIKAEATLAQEHLQRHLKGLKNALKSEALFQIFMKHYSASLPIRGIFQAAYNNLPVAAKNGTIAALKDIAIQSSTEDFLGALSTHIIEAFKDCNEDGSRIISEAGSGSPLP